MMARWNAVGRPFAGFARRLEVIVATGMPGLYRVIAFLAIQKIYGLSDLGRTGAAFSIAQTVGFFTAIGWASLILVRVPAASDRSLGVRRFYELAGMGILTLLCCCVLISLVGLTVHFDASPAEVIVILAGWSLYQLSRHYYLAHRRYRFILLTDTALLAVTFLSIFCFHQIGFTAGMPIGFALAVIGLSMLVPIGTPKPLPNLCYEPKGLEFGFTNFLSGGIALSLVPIASYTDGARFAGVMSLIASFCAISALIPRAITMYRLPELSRAAAASESLHELTRKTSREIGIASGSIFVVNAVVVFVICWLNASGAHLTTTFASGLAMSAIGCISMSSMAHSNVLMVREASKSAMFINMIACGLYIGITLMLFFVNGHITFLSVLATCVAVTVLRNVLLKEKSTTLSAPRLKP